MSEAIARTSLVPAWLVEHRRPVAWLLIALLVLLACLALMLGLAAEAGAQPFAPQHPIAFASTTIVIAAYGSIFAMLVGRVPQNVVAWLFGAFALVAATSNAIWAYLTYATETVPPQLPATEAAVLLGVMLTPVWSLCIIALILCFPDGRPLSRGWAMLLALTCLTTVVASISFALSSGPLPIYIASSPLGLSGALGGALAVIAPLILLVQVLLIVPCLWSLRLRYRTANDVGRLQLKWLAYGGAVFGITAVAFLVFVGPAFAPGSDASTALWVQLCAGATVVPIAAGVAILRYHLYDIETIIGRTLVYGSLTAILAGIYTAGIRLFNWLFVEMTGEDSDVALVVTTLVLATTFTPIKTWLEAKVKDRRGVIVDPAIPVEQAPDADAERIAERAAAIVMERLAAGPRSTAPPPLPERATVE